MKPFICDNYALIQVFLKKNERKGVCLSFYFAQKVIQ